MAQAALLSRVGVATGGLRHVQPQELAAVRQLAMPAGLGFTRIAANRMHAGVAVKTFALFGSNKAKPAKAPVSKKPAVKVEDGIFGTSGGIGFTKANELFVGRVAMLGFAASILGEALTGKGTLAQFDFETGIPLTETEPLLLFFILFTLLGAIGALGDRGRFVDDAPVAGLDSAIIKPGKGVKGALGLNEKGPVFGFTKSNELFVGRLAQLGIAFSIIGEIVTGKGTLAQLNIETGVPITEIEPLILFNVIFFLFAAVNPGTGKFVSDDDIEE
jgi:photosystem II protein